MKKNLWIAGTLIVIAATGIGVLVALPFFQPEDDGRKTIKPRPEPVALVPKPAPTKKTTPVLPTAIEKKPAPEKKVEPEPKKTPGKIEPEPKKSGDKEELKAEPKKRTAAKIITVGDDLVKLNDADGEYVVQPLKRGLQLKVIGIIKTLRITGVQEEAHLDAADLDAREIIVEGGISEAQLTLVAKDVEFRGAISGAKTQVNVSLTKAGSLKLKRVAAGVRVHYSKANASDPEPRLELGDIDVRAQVLLVPVRK